MNIPSEIRAEAERLMEQYLQARALGKTDEANARYRESVLLLRIVVEMDKAERAL